MMMWIFRSLAKISVLTFVVAIAIVLGKDLCKDIRNFNGDRERKASPTGNMALEVHEEDLDDKRGADPADIARQYNVLDIYNKLAEYFNFDDDLVIFNAHDSHKENRPSLLTLTLARKDDMLGEHHKITIALEYKRVVSYFRTYTKRSHSKEKNYGPGQTKERKNNEEILKELNEFLLTFDMDVKLTDGDLKLSSNLIVPGDEDAGLNYRIFKPVTFNNIDTDVAVAIFLDPYSGKVVAFSAPLLVPPANTEERLNVNDAEAIARKFIKNYGMNAGQLLDSRKRVTERTNIWEIKHPDDFKINFNETYIAWILEFDDLNHPNYLIRIGVDTFSGKIVDGTGDGSVARAYGLDCCMEEMESNSHLKD